MVSLDDENSTAEPEPTVYVVDDDEATRRLIVRLLEDVFPKVETFESANDFLAAYRPDAPGCLVLDVAMPGMSGLELQKVLAEREIRLPIVFLTAVGNVQMAVNAIQAGAVNFLEKPFRRQELWESVRTAIQVDRQIRSEQADRTKTADKLARLALGEREVLALILAGKYNKEIAAQLNLSVRTVEDRRARLMRKLEVGSVVELVRAVMPFADEIQPDEPSPAERR